MEKKISTKTIAYVGVLSAIYIALAYLSAGTNEFKVTFESFAIVIGALTLGPVPGLCIGLVGEFAHQLLLYGIDPTTPLWLIPYTVEGLVCGLMMNGHRTDEPGNKLTSRLIWTIVVSELVLSILNIPVLGISSVYQGWGSWPVVIAGIPLRLVLTAVRIAVYSVIVTPLYTRIRKVVR